LDLIKEAQRTYEQRRRTYGDIFDLDSDSDENEEENTDKTKKDLTNTDSDAPTSTDTDSPYGSDSESSSSYDEYHAKREIPKKKVHKHDKGPVKSYFEEVIGNWPKYRYKKYKRRHMKKHGIQINYGNIHTKQIKRSLKVEKHERKKYEHSLSNVCNMMENVAKETTRLLLDPEHPNDCDKLSLSSTKSAESEHASTKSTENERTSTKPKSTFHKIKQKVKKSFKKKHKRTFNPYMNGDDEQTATNSDARDEFQKSNHSLNKV
jgi:hypothetical protein